MPLFENLPGGGEGFGQLAPHTDGLAALTGEHIGTAHSRTLLLSVSAGDRRKCRASHKRRPGPVKRPAQPIAGAHRHKLLILIILSDCAGVPGYAGPAHLQTWPGRPASPEARSVGKEGGSTG